MKLFDWTQDGLKEVTATSDYSKPTLICFGGSDTTDLGDAQTYVRYMQNWMGRVNIFTPDIRLTVATYPYNTQDLVALAARHNYQTARKGHFDVIAMEFVKSQFLPLIATNAKFDTADNLTANNLTGEKLPLEQVKRHFNNIRVLTHSIGGVIGEQIGNALVHCMAKLGYSEQEIDEATREILMVNVGSTAYPMAQQAKANCTQIALVNAKDMMVKYHCSTIEDLMMETEDYGRVQPHNRREILPLNILPYSSSKMHKVTVFPDTIGDCESTGLEKEDGKTFNVDDGYIGADFIGKLMHRDAQGALQINPRSKDAIRHRLDTYFEPKLGKHGFMIPTMMQCAFINSFNNSLSNQDTSSPFTSLPTPRELFRVPEKALYAQATPADRGINGNPMLMASVNGYDERIEQALAEEPVRPGQKSIWQR